MQNRVSCRIPVFWTRFLSLFVGPEDYLGDARSFVLITSNNEALWLFEQIHIKKRSVVIVTSTMDTGQFDTSQGEVPTVADLHLIETFDQFIGAKRDGLMSGGLVRDANSNSGQNTVLVIWDHEANQHFGYNSDRKPVSIRNLAMAMAALGVCGGTPQNDLEVFELKATSDQLPGYKKGGGKQRGHGAYPMSERRAPKRISPTGLRH